METVVTLLWLLCSVLSPSPDRPYLPAEEMNCAPASGMICCELTYITDRYCCDGSTDRCEDDCTPEERVADERNALRSTEIWCKTGLCAWSLEGYGWH